MRLILILLALSAGAYAISRRSGRGAPQRSAAFAGGQPASGPHPVRDSGPEAMRDPPQGQWSSVDEASDQSFPASDPPATY